MKLSDDGNYLKRLEPKSGNELPKSGKNGVMTCALCGTSDRYSISFFWFDDRPNTDRVWHYDCNSKSTRLERVAAGLESDPYKVNFNERMPDGYELIVAKDFSCLKGATMSAGYTKPEPMPIQGDWLEDWE